MAGFLQIVAPLLAGRVIQADYKVCQSGSHNSFFNLLPGGQQIAQADHAAVMSQRSAQYSCPSQRSCDAGNNLQFHLGILRPNLIHQACHPIDAGISAAYHGHLLSCRRFLISHAAAFYLLPHRRVPIVLIRKFLFQQVRIHGIPDDYLAHFYGPHGLHRHLLIGSRAYSNYIDLIQI